MIKMPALIGGRSELNWQPVTSRVPQKTMVDLVSFSIYIKNVDNRAEGSLTVFADDEGER